MNNPRDDHDHVSSPTNRPLSNRLIPCDEIGNIPLVSCEDFAQHYRDTGQYLAPPSAARIAKIVTNAFGDQVMGPPVSGVLQPSRAVVAGTPNIETLVRFLYERVLIHAYVFGEGKTDCEKLTQLA